SEQFLFFLEDFGVGSLQFFQLGLIHGVFEPFQMRLVKVYRRLVELEEYKNHYPYEENEELHGDFQHPVKQQPQPALRKRAAAQVSLNLGLVRPEVRKE